MDAGTIQAAAAVGVPVVGFIYWLVRLEGRQNTHESVCTERWTETRKKLDHIDEKLDRLVESR